MSIKDDFYDDPPWTEVVFAEKEIEAIKEGARRLGYNDESADDLSVIEAIEHPEWARFAKWDLVPVRKLLRAGWWYECAWCYHKISEDGCEDCAEARAEEEDVEADAFMRPPLYRFDDVYCSRECSTARREDIAERKRIEEEAKQAALVKWPGIEIIRSGCGCSPREGEGSRYLGYVAFKFPGQKYGAISWNVGDTTVWCPEGDKSAFEGWQRKLGR